MPDLAVATCRWPSPPARPGRDSSARRRRGSRRRLGRLGVLRALDACGPSGAPRVRRRTALAPGGAPASDRTGDVRRPAATGPRPSPARPAGDAPAAARLPARRRDAPSFPRPQLRLRDLVDDVPPLRRRQAALLLAELARVARRAVLVNDLERHVVPWAAISLLVPFAESAMVRHDAPLSVLRGWTAAELASVAAAAGLGPSARVSGSSPTGSCSPCGPRPRGAHEAPRRGDRGGGARGERRRHPAGAGRRARDSSRPRPFPARQALRRVREPRGGPDPRPRGGPRASRPLGRAGPRSCSSRAPQAGASPSDPIARDPRRGARHPQARPRSCPGRRGCPARGRGGPGVRRAAASLHGRARGGGLRGRREEPSSPDRKPRSAPGSWSAPTGAIPRRAPRGSGPRPQERQPRFGLKAHFRGAAWPGGAVELHYFRGGYLGLQDVGGGTVNACALIDREVAGPIPRSPEEFLRTVCFKNPLARQRLEGAERITEWQAAGALFFGAGSPVLAGAFLSGDAAGTIDPFAGEGMSMALRSGELAAEEILRALERGDDALALERYGERWKAEFSRRIALAAASAGSPSDLPCSRRCWRCCALFRRSAVRSRRPRGPAPGTAGAEPSGGEPADAPQDAGRRMRRMISGMVGLLPYSSRPTRNSFAIVSSPARPPRQAPPLRERPPTTEGAPASSAVGTSSRAPSAGRTRARGRAGRSARRAGAS